MAASNCSFSFGLQAVNNIIVAIIATSISRIINNKIFEIPELENRNKSTPVSKCLVDLTVQKPDVSAKTTYNYLGKIALPGMVEYKKGNRYPVVYLGIQV